MQQTTNNTQPSQIGNVAIVPGAEPVQQGPTAGLAQQEQTFYQQSGEQYRLMQNQQDLGWLGKFFGSGSSAPTNIAGFVVVMSVLALLASFAMTESNTVIEGRKLIIGLISSALSFIFGAASKK